MEYGIILGTLGKLKIGPKSEPVCRNGEPYNEKDSNLTPSIKVEKYEVVYTGT